MKLISFLILFVIVFSLLILGFFWDDIKIRSEKTNHKKHVYKTLHNFAEEKDQLLLNDVVCYLDGDTAKPTKIDHIVICSKYVYVIKDFSQDGGIYGNLADLNLFRQDKNGKKQRIENPVLENLHVVEKLEKLTHISHDQHLFVSVVVFNNSLIVPKGVAQKTQDSWFIPLHDLIGTIKVAEQDDIAPFSKEKGESLAQALKSKSDSTKVHLSVQKTDVEAESNPVDYSIRNN